MARKILRRRPRPRHDADPVTERADPPPLEETPSAAEPESPDTSENEPQLGPAAVYDSVADVLRYSREHYGRNLDEVAQALNIRKPYLDAIERSQFDRLPGTTYAVGFVRSYAEYLNLEPDEMVRRFKEEAAGTGRQPELVFPTPVPESRLPSGALILVSLVLLALAYGIWTWVADAEFEVTDLVPEVPERLASLLGPNGDEAEETAAGAEGEVAEPAPAAESAQPEPAGEPEAATPETSSEVVAESETVEPDAGETAAADPAVSAVGEEAETAATGEEPVVEPATVPAAPTVEPEPAVVTEASAAAQIDGTVPAAPSLPAVPEAPAVESAALTAPTEGAVAGGADDSSRITLRAIQDAWVQVRDPAGKTVFTKVLRAGESYRVPARSDLVLVTGNAGGLEIVVDNKSLGTMGPVGKVRRDVALDAERLLQGEGMTP